MDRQEIAATLYHHMIDTEIQERNLGQYRTAYTCHCGFEIVSDWHAGITRDHALTAHQAEKLTEAEVMK